MDYLLLVDFLDQHGFYKEADTIDSLIKESQRKPNWKNISLALSPIVLGLVMSHFNHPQQSKIHFVPQIKPTQTAPQARPTINKGDFSDFKEFLNEEEGGFSHRKHRFDPGGATYRGITQSTYNKYRHHKHLHHQPVTKITEQERDEIIKNRYWAPLKADYLPEATAKVIADWKFNGGFSPRFLQRLLGIEQTGIMDKKTVMAVWHYTGHDPEKDKFLANKLISMRQKYLESLKTRKHHKKVPLINYNRGWYKRLNDLGDSL